MKPREIKKLLSSYNDLVRLLKEGERFLAKNTLPGERSAAGRFLKRFRISLSPRFLPDSLSTIRQVLSEIEKAMEQENSDCIDCIREVLFLNKSHVFMEMNYFLSESTQRRVLSHFIGRIYMLLQISPVLRRNFRRVFWIIHSKNN